MRHPLAGITVVALEQAVAAPFATRQLADLGARVIKIERPGAGDFARGYDRTVHGQSSPLFDHQGMVVRAVREPDRTTTSVRDRYGRQTATGVFMP